jgi:hypothetical protein
MGLFGIETRAVKVDWWPGRSLPKIVDEVG